MADEGGGEKPRTEDERRKANIVVVGAGWWSQGWHLPHLSRNPSVNILAIVDRSARPKSNLDPDLKPLSELGVLYGCPTFASVEEVLFHHELGPRVDGAIVCTQHATHAEIGELLLREGKRRMCESSSGDGDGGRPMNILMEKPMTTDVEQASSLRSLVADRRRSAASAAASGGGSVSAGCFLVNHSANYRTQARTARDLISSGRIGSIRHISASFASPLGWIFEDPANTGWNEPDGSDRMVGNGFGWGQSSHLLAWIYHVCGGTSGGGLRPERVYCAMGHSAITGADVCHSATVRCSTSSDGSGGGGGVTMSLSGTSLLPGNAHSDPPVGKTVRIEIHGSDGSLLYSGDDRDSSSGRLELRLGESAGREHAGRAEVHCSELGFQFEDLDRDGLGPESLRSFVAACRGETEYYVGADADVGFLTVQTIDAMYRSHRSVNAEPVLFG